MASPLKKILSVTEDVAEFIASPRPSNPVLGQYHDYTRWVCDSYAQVPQWASSAAGVAGWGAVSLAADSICGEYLGAGLPQAVPPFTGGQCSTTYLVTLSNSVGFPTTATAYVTGPVGQAYYNGPPNQFGAVFWMVKGNPDMSFRTGYPEEKWRVSSVQRVDGQPDNCGNPKPPAPTPSPTRPPAPSPNPPGGGQPPTFDPEGNPVFRPGPIPNPYGDPIPMPPIDPFAPGEGDDDNPNDPSDPYPPLPPGEQGEGGDPVTIPPGGEGEGEAPPGKVLVGLKIDLLETPDSGKQFADGVWRGPCYIYMGGAEGLDHDPAGAMLRSGQFVFAERENLTKWRVSANTGYRIRTTPYYREAE